MTQSLIQELVKRFNQEGVLYCHWKSKSLVGEQDVDFLIPGHSLALATEILMQLGFKGAAPRWGANPPGVFHYYGHDANQDDLVHLHLFTQVLTGGKFFKSHLFPFEEMMFKNTFSLNGLIVTSREAELVLFILKTFIRYGSLLDLVRLLKGDVKVQEDALRLKEGSNVEEVAALLEEYCPSVDIDLFLECLNAILDQAPYIKKLLLSFRIHRRLRAYRKHSLPAAFLGHLQLLMESLLKKVRKQKGSKTLLSGGAIISIVGADATGKSTLVSETNRWLRKNFVVRTVHAGKPPATWVTFPIKLLLVLFRLVKGKSKLKVDLGKSLRVDSREAQRSIGSLNSLMYATRAVGLAWDRRALLWKVRQASANGEIIVCDRYPTNATGMMDSPRLMENPNQDGLVASIYNWLTRMERTLYRQIPPPDIVLRLNVSLEIAKQRNAARAAVDDETYLENRHQQAKAWFMSGTRCIQDINTDLPLAETILAVKRAIWHSL